MSFKWRKWNKALHRDLGYFFFTMTVIYSVSGIAVNYLLNNPGRWWTLYSGVIALALILMAGSGLFILSGETGSPGVVPSPSAAGRSCRSSA